MSTVNRNTPKRGSVGGKRGRAVSSAPTTQPKIIGRRASIPRSPTQKGGIPADHKLYPVTRKLEFDEHDEDPPTKVRSLQDT
eukprot:gene814-12092_t